MPKISALRAQLTQAVEKEYVALLSINLHWDAQAYSIPVMWLLDSLHDRPATMLAQTDHEYEKFLNLGKMAYTLRKGFSKDQYIGMGAGHLLVVNSHTKKHRLKSVKELLLGQVSPAASYPRTKLYKAKNLGTKRVPIYEVPQEGENISAPEFDATKEELNPQLQNGVYMVLSDLQTFRGALDHWLKEIAPKLYRNDLKQLTKLLKNDKLNP